MGPWPGRNKWHNHKDYRKTVQSILPNRERGDFSQLLSYLCCLWVFLFCFVEEVHISHLKIFLYYTEDSRFIFREVFRRFGLIKILFLFKGQVKQSYTKAKHKDPYSLNTIFQVPLPIVHFLTSRIPLFHT